VSEQSLRECLAKDVAVAARASFNAWEDQRYLSRKQLWSLWLFTEHLENVANAGGWSVDGHSWKEKAPLGILVVKATVDGEPKVSFTSARTFLNAVVIFVRKATEARITWVTDRYRV